MEKTIYKRKVDVEYFNFEDGILVMKAGNCYELNEISNFIFLEINGENDLENIVEKMSIEYDAEKKEIKDDIIKLCNMMVNAEIIEKID